MHQLTNEANVGFVSAMLFAEILEMGSGGDQYSMGDLADNCTEIAMALVGFNSDQQLADQVIERYGEPGFFALLAEAVAPLFDLDREVHGNLYSAPSDEIIQAIRSAGLFK